MSMWIDWSSCSYPPQLLKDQEKRYLPEEFPFGSSSAQELFLEPEALIRDLRLSVWELDKNELIANPSAEDLDDRLTGLCLQILESLKNWDEVAYRAGEDMESMDSQIFKKRGEDLKDISNLIDRCAIQFLRFLGIDPEEIFLLDWLSPREEAFNACGDGDREVSQSQKFYVCREGWSQTFVGIVNTDEHVEEASIHVNYLIAHPERVIRRWENPAIRSGVGGALLDVVTDRARQIKAKRITLKPELYAIDFYLKQGYQSYGNNLYGKELT